VVLAMVPVNVTVQLRLFMGGCPKPAPATKWAVRVQCSAATLA
jgi:hypothetical protein